VVDPDLARLGAVEVFESRYGFVFNVDTEELLHSNMQSLQLAATPLKITELSEVVGLALSAAKKVHENLLQSS
jgi:hypothetical protein